MDVKKIFIGSDHAGFDAKAYLLDAPELSKYELVDAGTKSKVSCDYCEFGFKVALLVQSTPQSVGILICGSGTGICISANKVKGIRAFVGYNDHIAQLAVEHNNANVICFGARFIAKEEILHTVQVFLNAQFQGGRHQMRLDRLAEFEKEGK